MKIRGRLGVDWKLGRSGLEVYWEWSRGKEEGGD